MIVGCFFYIRTSIIYLLDHQVAHTSCTHLERERISCCGDNDPLLGSSEISLVVKTKKIVVLLFCKGFGYLYVISTREELYDSLSFIGGSGFVLLSGRGVGEFHHRSSGLEVVELIPISSLYGVGDAGHLSIVISTAKAVVILATSTQKGS